MEDPGVLDLLSELDARHGIRRQQDIDDREIVERCLYSLEEGIAHRAGDIATGNAPPA